MTVLKNLLMQAKGKMLQWINQVFFLKIYQWYCDKLAGVHSECIYKSGRCGLPLILLKIDDATMKLGGTCSDCERAVACSPSSALQWYST